jgi:NifB/MoaA-like Fe-S oxidoreductase
MNENLFEPISLPSIYDMTEPMREFLNVNDSTPDLNPDWDYAELWQHIRHLQRDINALAQLLTQQEQASVEANQLIRKYLDQVCDKVIGASQCVPHDRTAAGSYLVDGGKAGIYRISR